MCSVESWLLFFQEGLQISVHECKLPEIRFMEPLKFRLLFQEESEVCIQ